MERLLLYLKSLLDLTFKSENRNSLGYVLDDVYMKVASGVQSIE